MKPTNAVNTAYLNTLKEILATIDSQDELYQSIVDAPFHDKKKATLMGLGIVVLLLANKSTGMIDRVALSRTPPAKGTTDITMVPFREIKIPADHKENYIVQAIQSGEPRMTTDWQYLFNPALTPVEARFNQAGGGIACSYVYPLRNIENGGALIFSYYESPDRILDEHSAFMETYSKLVSERLSR